MYNRGLYLLVYITKIKIKGRERTSRLSISKYEYTFTGCLGVSASTVELNFNWAVVVSQ